MTTREQMVEVLNFLEKAYSKYHSNKKSTINLVRNYLLSHNDLNEFLMSKDLAYSEFKRNGRFDADFTSAFRTLHNEINDI